MPHRMALPQRPASNPTNGRAHLKIVPPIPMPKSEYRVRVVGDDELPTGKDWLLVVVPGGYTLAAIKASALVDPERATTALEACWAGFRALRCP